MLRRRSFGRLLNQQIRPHLSSTLIPVDGRPYRTSLCVPLPVPRPPARRSVAGGRSFSVRGGGCAAHKHGWEGLLLRSRACAGRLFASFSTPYYNLVPVLPEKRAPCTRSTILACEGSSIRPLTPAPWSLPVSPSPTLEERREIVKCSPRPRSGVCGDWSLDAGGYF